MKRFITLYRPTSLMGVHERIPCYNVGELRAKIFGIRVPILWALNKMLLIFALMTLGCADTRALRHLEHDARRISWRDARSQLAEGASHGVALDRLMKLAADHGWMIIFKDLSEERLVGQTSHGVIMLEETLGIDASLEVLAHELAHVLQPPNLEPVDAEVFAEAVSVLVCRHAGLDVEKNSAAYLADLRLDLRVLHEYRDEIDRVVKELSK